jgi:hypothetical protein
VLFFLFSTFILLQTVNNFMDCGITFTVLNKPPLFSVLITFPIH